jgi:hypothetical protein
MPRERAFQGDALIHPTQADGLPIGELSVVYAIGIDGMAKLGTTRNLRKRFATLQASCPTILTCFGWFEGGKVEERQLHDIFMRERRHGEWFYATDRLVAFINTFSPEALAALVPSIPEHAWPGGGRFGSMSDEDEIRLGFARGAR